MKVKAVFQSDQEIGLPTKESNGREVYLLRKDGIEYDGRPGERGMIASFDIPLRSSLVCFDFEYTVTLQFPSKRRYVIVIFDRADLYQVYELLTSTLGARFRLKSFHLGDDLITMWRRWPYNLEYLIFQLKHDLKGTLHFVKANLPELITVMSLARVPRRFDEQFKWTFNL